MTVAEFLSELRSRDVHLWLDADQVKCSAPVGMMTPELREQLRDRQNDILRFLRLTKALRREKSCIVPLQRSGARIPVFAVPGHNGDVFFCRRFAQCLGDDQPFFGLQPPGLLPDSAPLASVPELASYFAEQIRAFQPQDPYVIAGFCAGGIVAYELARQLCHESASIPLLILFGCPYPTYFRFPNYSVFELFHRLQHARRHAARLRPLSWQKRWLYVSEEVRLRRLTGDSVDAEVAILRTRLQEATRSAVRRYAPDRFEGRVCLMLPSKKWARSGYAALRWRSVAQRTEEYFGPDDCDTDTMFRDPHVSIFADIFRDCCERHCTAPVRRAG